MKRIAVAIGIAVALTACESSRSPIEPRRMRAGELNPAAVVAQPELVPGQYIVVFKSDVADPATLAQTLIRAHRATHRFTYTHAVKGFAASMSDVAAAALARNPQVAYVEQDLVEKIGNLLRLQWIA